MKTVALISGGKDSCFNMMQCVAEGHHIVALANLHPPDKATDELDSYMYQTVGHHAIDLYAEAMGLPLYRQPISGTAVGTGRDYQPQDSDEVEDLYRLLHKVQSEVTDIEAVAVGAILSDYQRVRVENVCLRLGLTPLAYLWRRQQAPLLREMVDCGVHAILIKVAALGLNPECHLGRCLQQILPHMLKMEEKYGLNVCGEGGEYETFTLDCPLFLKKIVVDEMETVIHSADAFAPVGFLHFKKMHLEDKNDDRQGPERLKGLPLTTSKVLMEKLKRKVQCSDVNDGSQQLHLPLTPPLTDVPSPCSTVTEDCFSVGGIVASFHQDLTATTLKAMDQLKALVENLERKLADIYFMCLYVSRMSDFGAINAVYKTYLGINPPARICVGACLPEGVAFQMDCQGWTGGDQREGDQDTRRQTMHVQGVSHWAPANIGPYSQATRVGGRVFIAGQIPLVPGSMQLVTGGVGVQSRLALTHASSVLRAMCPGRSLKDVLLCVCYLTHPDYIPIARQQWRELLNEERRTEEADPTEDPAFKSLLEFVVVPSLPRSASVEWQVYAACRDSPLKEYETSLTSSKFKAESRALHGDNVPYLLASTTCVRSLGNSCDEDFDAEAAVSACLHCYENLVSSMNKAWERPLLRIFYPAGLCAHDKLHAAFRQGLDTLASCLTIFTLVPVLQLHSRQSVLLMCH